MSMQSFVGKVSYDILGGTVIIHISFVQIRPLDPGLQKSRSPKSPISESVCSIVYLGVA